MKLNASEWADKLAKIYRATLEDGEFLASEMNIAVGADLFKYENNEIVIAKGVENLPHLRVEYDLEYFGGDYDNNGQFAFVPVALCSFIFDTVEEAFEAYTGINRQHIIHYSDEWFFLNGGNHE